MKDMHTLLSAAVSLVPAVQSATLKGGVDLQGFNAVSLSSARAPSPATASM